MAIAFRSSTDSGGTTTVGTSGLTINVPAGVQDGDLLLSLHHRNDNDNDFDAITGWTVLAQKREASGEDRTVCILYRVASSEPASYTFTTTDGTSEQWSGSILAYSGCNQSTPIDVSYVEGSHYSANLNVVSANSKAAPAITTATDGAWVIILEGVTDSLITSSADPSGYTNRIRGTARWNNQIQVWDKAVATAGTETPGAAAWTASANTQESSYITIAIKPATVGATPSPIFEHYYKTLAGGSQNV